MMNHAYAARLVFALAVTSAILVGGCGRRPPADTRESSGVNAPQKDEVLMLTLQPARGGDLVCGAVTKVDLIVTNRSKRVVVVERVAPTTTLGNEPADLAGSAYGSISRNENDDTFTHNAMAQQETHLAFHSGLLLPGEALNVRLQYRPVARSETFEIAYRVSAQDYDRSPATLAPFKVYVPDESASPMGDRTFVPFTHDRWVASLAPDGVPGRRGPHAPRRSVLIPDLAGAPEHQRQDVSFALDENAFCLEDARATASGITGRPAQSLRLAYSSAFGGFAVLEGSDAWLLKGRQQADRGQLFASFPPVMLMDVDTGRTIRVRVGETQEGFGPDARESAKRFWDVYRVIYGDGMYTRGEFVTLARDEVLAFLKEARQRKMTVGLTTYFFGSRYYTLVDSSRDGADRR
jgi:hypothetical protein